MPSIQEKKSDYLQDWTKSEDKAVLLVADGE